MSESETQKTAGIDGLVEFGRYLATLADDSYRDYSFEMPDDAGALRECSLNEVLDRFEALCSRKTNTFRVAIGYVDYQQGTIGRSDRTFTRQKQ